MHKLNSKHLLQSFKKHVSHLRIHELIHMQLKTLKPGILVLHTFDMISTKAKKIQSSTIEAFYNLV